MAKGYPGAFSSLLPLDETISAVVAPAPMGS
jgi:hypothetical protein